MHVTLLFPTQQHFLEIEIRLANWFYFISILIQMEGTRPWGFVGDGGIEWSYIYYIFKGNLASHIHRPIQQFNI